MQLTHNSFHVRVGSMGEIWRLGNTEGLQLKRGDRVICRTGRGVELGTVASGVNISSNDGDPISSGAILRIATTEDELLESRLCRFKEQAMEECRQQLIELQYETVLLEVDHLFDGRTLIFHFLGQVDQHIQTLTDRLVDAYEKQTRLKHFAKLLAEGCGPACGTKEGGGCGSTGGCAVCVVASACKSGSQ